MESKQSNTVVDHGLLPFFINNNIQNGYKMKIARRSRDVHFNRQDCELAVGTAAKLQLPD